jgi:CRISPR-associated endonuclease/helicase Cas3
VEYISHTSNKEGKNHGLSDHLKAVSEIMVSFANGLFYKDVFRLTGLFHDFGKYQPAFQKYLIEGGRKGSVPHASWGAMFALQYKIYEAAFAIDGHHKGLPDKADLKDDCDAIMSSNDEFRNTGKDLLLNDLMIMENDCEVPALSLKQSERELFIRYLFSALTDADWLDTEKHFNSELSKYRRVCALDVDFLNNKLETEIKSKSKEGELNQLRNRVRENAVARSNSPLGFFSMTLPTGMGKTFTSVSWALHHAKHNDLKRIIIVHPGC